MLATHHPAASRQRRHPRREPAVQLMPNGCPECPALIHQHAQPLRLRLAVDGSEPFRPLDGRLVSVRACRDRRRPDTRGPAQRLMAHAQVAAAPLQLVVKHLLDRSGHEARPAAGSTGPRSHNPRGRPRARLPAPRTAGPVGRGDDQAQKIAAAAVRQRLRRGYRQGPVPHGEVLQFPAALLAAREG